VSPRPERSLVELVVTEKLDRALATVDAELVQRLGLRPADAPDRLALLVSRVVVRVVEALDEGSRPRDGAAIVRELVAQLHAAAPKAGVAELAPVAAAEVLRAVLTRRPDGTPEPIAAPLIPLLDTTLLTNAPGEPSVGHQVATEIDSSDRIDVLMAFVRRSGIRPFEDALGAHCRRGRPLRILTTTYTGSTERAALDALVRLGAHVRVSYDTTTTRLHAKSWLFHRDARLSGVDFSTAYIGSSNLTHSAQNTGLEWNVRVSGARNPDVLVSFPPKDGHLGCGVSDLGLVRCGGSRR
jgi:HKD family nuclease